MISTLDYLQLVSLPLVVLGILLASVEWFFPKKAKAILNHIVALSSDMPSIVKGLVTIIALGLNGATFRQRVIVISSLMATFVYLASTGGNDRFLLMLVIWPTCIASIIVIYLVTIFVFRVLQTATRKRILGISGILITGAGLLIESIQFSGSIEKITISLGESSASVDIAGVFILIYYAAAFLCVISLARIAHVAGKSDRPGSGT
jgi:hypothetical protein